MTRAFAERWLMPRLERFACAFPNVTVNIHASEDVIDLRAEGIDLSVRYGPPHGGIGQTVLLEDHYIAVAASAICGSGAVQIDQFRNKPLLAYNENLLSPVPRGPVGSWRHPSRMTVISRFPWFGEETLAMHAAERGLGPLLSSNVLIDEGIKSGNDAPDRRPYHAWLRVPDRRTRYDRSKEKCPTVRRMAAAGG